MKLFSKLVSLLFAASALTHAAPKPRVEKPFDDYETMLEVGDDDIIEQLTDARPTWFASLIGGATVRSFVESNPRALFGASLAHRLGGRNIVGLKATSANESRTSNDAQFKLNVATVELYYALAVDRGIFEGVEWGPVVGIAMVDYLSSSTAGGRYALRSGQALMGARGSLTTVLSGGLAVLFEVELLGYFTKPQSSWIAFNPAAGLRYQW